MMRARRAAGIAAAIGFAVAGAGGPALAQDAAPPAAAPPAPAAAAAAVQPLTEGVVATVNDDVISTYDLRQRMRLLIVTSGVQPTQDNLQQIQREALRSLVDERLEMQEIRHQEKEQKFKIAASDEDVMADLGRMAQGNRMTADQLLNALASAGVGADTLREQLRAEISWQRWIQGRYGGSRLKVSPAQVNAVMTQIEAEAAKPQYQISEIFIDAARVGGLEVATNGAQQLIGQLQQGAPFPAVARQFSAAPTAANGGDAGWLAESQLPPEVRNGISELSPGQLSRPIPAKDGVYIILLRDKRAGAGADLVTLKQAAIALPATASAEQIEAARQKLAELKSKVNGCGNLESAASKVQGVVAADLGEANLKDLRPDFRDAVANLQINQVSDPIRTDVGLHLIAVCAKRESGVTLPSREEVESRLEDEQLSLISRRYLRDLRNSATIETR
ncbi:MAG: peptidylprolyl isomerase [Caulobacteraceae bacterium]|nr:peptidylprolyl isomerase [Caulobacteraceae bacterium]